MEGRTLCFKRRTIDLNLFYLWIKNFFDTAVFWDVLPYRVVEVNRGKSAITGTHRAIVMVLFDNMLKRVSITRNLADVMQCVAMPENLKAGK
jgi:hypothetical protein